MKFRRGCFNRAVPDRGGFSIAVFDFRRVIFPAAAGRFDRTARTNTR
jgi:hypothetical protein